MEIPLITSTEIKIGEIEIPKITPVTERYTSIPMAPPVVVNIGVPVVDIPGCVEAHQTNNAKNNQIKSDDERGTYTCLLYTSPSPRDKRQSRMPSSA